jgi:hypothetical protein
MDSPRRFRRLAAGALFLGLSTCAFAGFASTETFLPAVGRVSGQGGAQFYTTVWATNLAAAPISFTFNFLKQGQANANPAKFTDTLAAGETKVYENVVEAKLGLTSALGAARITATGEILVAERIYNQAPGTDLADTEGLFFAGVPKTFSISAGQSASIQGIDQGGSENFRYNFALVETGGGSPTVNVQVVDGAGVLLGQKAYPLQPYEQLQPNVAEIVTGIHTTNARITATVTEGTGSVLLAGAQLANISQDSSGFEMSFRDELLAGSSTGGGLTVVAHDATLKGDGSANTPLGIANGQVVRSLNGLHDTVTLAAGSNVTITPSGSTLTIASTGGSGGLTLPFAGTGATPGPLFSITNSSSDINQQSTAVLGISGIGPGVQGQSGDYFGVYGRSTNFYGVVGVGGGGASGVFGRSAGGDGVLGEGSAGHFGVRGMSGDAGVKGETGGGIGVFGEDSGTGGVGVEGTTIDGYGVAGFTSTSFAGIYGKATGGGWAGGFDGRVGVNGDLHVSGAITAGTKDFASPHPTDPSKQIVFTCLEGPESGTYFRGTSRIVGGMATIMVPDDFRLVTSPRGLTAQLTPVGDFAILAVMTQDLDQIVVRGSNDVEFHYMVNGVRKGFENHVSIRPNELYVPRSPDDDMAQYMAPGVVRMLQANGILNPDGSVNLETAHRLGWDQDERWKRAEAKTRTRNRTGVRSADEIN